MTDNLDLSLAQELKTEIEKRGNRVAYISSEPQVGDRPYYLSTIEDYHAINEKIQVDYFDLSENFSDEQLLELVQYGTIYLSGGNTYTFMDSANKRNLFSILKKHLDNDGLMVGASAGSIMMTQSIDLAEYGDENNILLKNTAGFGFVDFEFWPHFSNTVEEQKCLADYKKRKNIKVYVCEDGGGVFVRNGKIDLFGATTEFPGHLSI